MRLFILLMVATLLSGSSLLAQRKTLTLDAGFVSASGNSDFTSANLGEKAGWGMNGWGFSQTTKVLLGKTSGKQTAESYDAGVRAQRAVSGRIGVFAIAIYQRDPFAGLASRWSGGPGVAVGLLRSAHDTLGVETALTEQRERSTAAVSRSFAATRSAALFKHSFAASASLSEALEWVANLKTSPDYRLNSETALTAPLSRQIALRVAYVIRFDNQPEPGFKKSDRILTTGVQVAL
jgi:putative salt-induced outer membrane protein